MTSLVVPFTSREWTSVRDDYKKHGADLIPARNILAMWKLRRGNDTPVILQITSLLLNVDIVDSETDRSNLVAMDSLLNNYCTVVIRVVNYINEICQDPDSGLRSIASAVGRYNIPDWIVEIRHRGAHKEMPPLELFKQATDYLRNWMWDKYWSKPVEEAMTWAVPLKAFENEQKREKILKQKQAAYNLIVSFVEWRNDNNGPPEEAMFATPVMKNLNKFIENNTEVMIELLASDVLLLTEDKLKKFGLDFLCADGIWEIPQTVQLYWAPLCLLMNQNKLLLKLIVATMDFMHQPTTSVFERKQMAGWVHLYLELIVQRLDMQKCDEHEKAAWRRIVKIIIAQGQDFKPEMAITILRKTGFFQGPKLENLCKLLKLKIREERNLRLGPSNRTVEKTLQKVNNNLRQINTNGSTPTTLDKNADCEFVVADVDFSGSALGLMPDQTVESLNLIIYD